jgi:lipopolysaccharide export system protein LptA
MLTRHREALLALAVVVAFTPTLAPALSTDDEQPIVIEAAEVEADDRTQTTVYRGDVVITQGTRRITGDTVWIYYDDSNAITKAVSVGQLATFQQLADGKEDYTNADAERMEYYADRGLIILIGKARYREGKDVITAPRIEYLSGVGQVKAGPQTDGGESGTAATGESQGSDRVRITITPTKE